MKYLFKTLALAAVVGFSSCSKDDDNKKEDQQNNIQTGLVGEWNLSKMEIRDGKMSMANQNVGTFTAISSDAKGGLHFKDDGTVVSNIGYTTTMTMSFSIPGLPPVTQDVTETIPQVNQTGTYELIDDNTLRITNPDTSITYNVVSYTANKMELEHEVETSEISQGMPVDMVATNYMELTR